MSIELKSYNQFFSWCSGYGLVNDKDIATAFGRTPQTIRNWKKTAARVDCSEPPLHLMLACLGYEISRQHTGELVPPFPEMSDGWFEMWRRSQGLNTLEAVGEAFGLTRQAIHNWNKRGRLPRWLPLACIGFEENKAGMLSVQ